MDNRRYICLQFTAKESVTMHGFAGYFDTSLYDHIKLSEAIVALWLDVYYATIL